MTTNPRPYAGESDLTRMKQLLIAGKLASPFSAYVHPGDLDWWVYYDTSGEPLTERVWLWEDADRLLGWVFIWPGYSEFDIYAHPAVRATQTARILDWMEIHLPQMTQAHTSGMPEEIAVAAYADDDLMISLLEGRGYRGAPQFVSFSRSLDADLPVPRLPDGFRFLERMDAAYTEQRSAVHASAFTRLNPDGSVASRSKMTPDYYQRFMQAPGYDPDLDVVVVAPDGSFAAFVMAWADSTIKIGEFEPVGTHHDYQRRGLGRAALIEAMRRLRQRGIETATVMTWAKDEGNIAFYQSAGFALCNTLLRFARKPT